MTDPWHYKEQLRLLESLWEIASNNTHNESDPIRFTVGNVFSKLRIDQMAIDRIAYMQLPEYLAYVERGTAGNRVGRSTVGDIGPSPSVQIRDLAGQHYVIQTSAGDPTRIIGQSGRGVMVPRWKWHTYQTIADAAVGSPPPPVFRLRSAPAIIAFEEIQSLLPGSLPARCLYDLAQTAVDYPECDVIIGQISNQTTTATNAIDRVICFGLGSIHDSNLAIDHLSCVKYRIALAVISNYEQHWPQNAPIESYLQLSPVIQFENQRKLITQMNLPQRHVRLHTVVEDSEAFKYLNGRSMVISLAPDYPVRQILADYLRIRARPSPRYHMQDHNI